MAKRLYAKYKFEQLCTLFKANRENLDVLKELLDELKCRKRNRRLPSLIRKVEDAISAYKINRIKTTGRNIKQIVTDDPSDCSSSDYSDLNSFKDPKITGTVLPSGWDPEQRMIIELDEYKTKIIEAGPGTGKTAVACARVSHLIEQCDLEASKIFLISFTRTAVKELRDRIESFSQDPINVAGLQIFTLDSFTWQVLRGMGEEASDKLMGSYESNIKSFIQQLHDRDPQLLDYLEEFEHVVLDESQDLVGDRAELAIHIIRNLNNDCGVTIFADSAQAIYGFTDDSDEYGIHQNMTVVERILGGEVNGFERKKLVNVHRTDDPKLKELFTVGRDRLLDRVVSDTDSWKAMKELITSCAHGCVGCIEDQVLAGKSDHLILYRTRAEVLMESSFLWSDGVDHKLRMSGTPERIFPWIGRLLGELDAEVLSYDEFVNLWREKIANSNSNEDICREQAWKLLLDNVGDKHNCIKIVRLREILTRDRPPIDFLVDESTLPGPVLGTIHASKGREANQVHLMLPPDKFMDFDENSRYELNAREIAEEERVLFVGATRARKKLMVGEGKKLYASRWDERRTYTKTRKWNTARLIEVGLKGDIDITGMADGRLSKEHHALQDWLWRNAIKKVELEARFDDGLRSYVLYTADDMPIGILSKSFRNDLLGIAKTIGGKENKGYFVPCRKIKNIRMVGVTTSAIPEANRDSIVPPWRHSGFILTPIISGFPLVFFNKGAKG